MGFIRSFLGRIPIIGRFFGPKLPSKSNLVPDLSVRKIPRISLERISRSESDLKQRALNFEKFIAEWSKQDSEASKKFSQTEGYEVLEALFLGLKPGTAINQKFPKNLLEQYGFKVYSPAGSRRSKIIYNPEEVSKVIRDNPDIFTEANNPDLAVKHTLETNFDFDKEIEIRDNYWMRFGLIMGFPREACQGFVDNNHMETCEYLDKVFKLGQIDSVQSGFEINHESCKKILDRISSLGSGFDIEKILDNMKKLLEENIQRLLNLSKIQAPGIQWLPYGKLTQETEKIVAGMKRAFKISGIPKPTELFSKRVIEGHKEGLIKQQDLLDRVNKMKEELTPKSLAKAA